MSKQLVKYGEKTMELPAGMTLAQAKQQMARFFPELADPDVKTEKQGDDTIHTFSKKAGRKGADVLTTLSQRLTRVHETPVASPAVIAVALQAGDDAGVDLEAAMEQMVGEARAVQEWLTAAAALTPQWPAQSSQGLLL